MKTRQLLRTQKGAHLARRPAFRRQAALSALGALGALRVCATLRVPQSARAAEPKPSGDALRLNRGNRLHCNLVNGLPEAGPSSSSTRRLACGFSAAFQMLSSSPSCRPTRCRST